MKYKFIKYWTQFIRPGFVVTNVEPDKWLVTTEHGEHTGIQMSDTDIINLLFIGVIESDGVNIGWLSEFPEQLPFKFKFVEVEPVRFKYPSGFVERSQDIILQLKKEKSELVDKFQNALNKVQVELDKKNVEFRRLESMYDNKSDELDRTIIERDKERELAVSRFHKLIEVQEELSKLKQCKQGNHNEELKHRIISLLNEIK